MEKEEDITEKIELEYYKFYDPKNNSVEFSNIDNELDGIKFRPGGPPLAFKADYDDFIFKAILQATRKNLKDGLLPI